MPPPLAAPRLDAPTPVAPEQAEVKSQDVQMKAQDLPPCSTRGCSKGLDTLDTVPKRQGMGKLLDEVFGPMSDAPAAMSDETPEPDSQKVRRIAGLDFRALEVIGGQSGEEDLSLSTPTRLWSQNST